MILCEGFCMSIHVTGYGAVTPLGKNADDTLHGLSSNHCAIRFVPEWSKTPDLYTNVAAFVDDFSNRFIARKTRRTMSKMSEMMCLAADEALAHAQLTPNMLHGKRVMIIVGSTTSSIVSLEQSFHRFLERGSASGQMATTMFKTMNHSLALNLASYLRFQGTVLSPSSACATGAEAIMLGGQFIKSGVCDIAICGGADELHMSTAIAFDTAHAASRGFNHVPHTASRPFDTDRDGVVVSEGAALTILESESSRSARGVSSHGTLVGWAQSCDGGSVAHSGVRSMADNMRSALRMAELEPSDIGYVNAHATATQLGDLYEAKATYDVFGTVPISSLKGHLGHSFAPCGTIEAIATLEMLRTGVFFPSLNLKDPDPKLPALDFLQAHRKIETNYAMSNNFAMGGMNVSLIFTKGI
jgi:3-oxoacyl-[acyl-carrier-protein] synthase II